MHNRGDMSAGSWFRVVKQDRQAALRSSRFAIPDGRTVSTLVWNQRHLMIVLREYEDFCNTHRPHCAPSQAAPLRPLPVGVADLDHFRIQRRDHVRGVIHEYRLVT
jgi:hypothetical protein